MIRLLVASLVCLTSVSLRAADWNRFRGPAGDGHSSAKNLPTEWSRTKNVAWKNEDVGEGWSSPVVWGDRIYLTAARPRSGGGPLERNLFAICIDGRSGKTIWDKLIFEQTASVAQRIHKKNSHASPTPITDGEHLWIHFGTQGTACLTLDGNVVWKRDDIHYRMNHGNGGSPILVDNVLFFSCDGSDRAFVIALDKSTGDTLWRKERPPVANSKLFSFNTPAAIEVDGRTQILSQGSDILTAFDPASGDEIWWFKYDGYSVIPKPLVAHGLVYICTSFNRSTLYAIDPTGKGDVTETHEVWSSSRSIPKTPSLIAVGNEIYSVSDDGVVTCFDALKGRQHWQQRIGGNYSASPIYADGKIYFLSETGVTTIVKPNPAKYQEVARNDMQEATLASMAVIGNDLLIRTDKALYRIK